MPDPRLVVKTVAASTGSPDQHIRTPVLPEPRTADVPDSRMRTREEAEAHVARVSFKCGPPRLLGVELEWIVHHRGDPRQPLDAETLAVALGRHAPPSIAPGGPHRPLPNGSTLTLEPGGQVEISSPPCATLTELLAAVTADASYLRQRLARRHLLLAGEGVDRWRWPRRLLHTPRYTAMESAFDRVGCDGRVMMRATAGIHVCLDVGERHRVAARWAALHTLGPVLIAAFANSPDQREGTSGWASARTRALARMDPRRHGAVGPGRDPAHDWAQRVLHADLMCVRREGADWTVPGGISFAEWIGSADPAARELPRPPTLSDLDYHLTTFFPPVRPQGYFEVRYVDAQPGQDWMVPVGVLAALFHDEETVDLVRDMTAEAEGLWERAGRDGLRDPVLARCAHRVLRLAARHISAMDGTGRLARRLAAFRARRFGSDRS